MDPLNVDHFSCTPLVSWLQLPLQWGCPLESLPRIPASVCKSPPCRPLAVHSPSLQSPGGAGREVECCPRVWVLCVFLMQQWHIQPFLKEGEQKRFPIKRGCCFGAPQQGLSLVLQVGSH